MLMETVLQWPLKMVYKRVVYNLIAEDEIERKGSDCEQI